MNSEDFLFTYAFFEYVLYYYNLLYILCIGEASVYYAVCVCVCVWMFWMCLVGQSVGQHNIRIPMRHSNTRGAPGN